MVLKPLKLMMLLHCNDVASCLIKLRVGLSFKDVEELMAIRGLIVDHDTIQRWVFKFTPIVEQQFNARKKQAENRRRLEETYIKALISNIPLTGSPSETR